MLICLSCVKHNQAHVQIVITEKIEKIKAIAKVNVMNPSGGRRGNLVKTVSGHENSQMAKKSVIGIPLNP
jgi:hypothetical protein